MAVRVAKPSTPGQRGMVSVYAEHLSKEAPCKSLLSGLVKKNGGRNNQGRITVRHQGGGAKRRLRIVDVKRHDKAGVPAIVERIEYDPNRSAHLALLKYHDGERRYIIAEKTLRAGMKVVSGPEAPISAGNALPLESIPVGTTIHAIELKPGKGAQIARSAGCSAKLIAKEGIYATIRLASGEQRKVHLECWAAVGDVSNSDHAHRKIGKAGKKRHLGIRPTVRGVAMNPVDHPLGGGEGRSSGGRPPCDPWGRPKGKRTRSNKRTDNVIVTSRHKDKN